MRMYGEFAGLYDPLMRDVDYDGWAGYISGFFPEGTLRVTDCACGTGEMTLRLAQLGHILTGVDISEDMLRVASEKARRAALKIPFIAQDMRRLELHRPQDVIVCVCDGVNYLDDMQGVEMFLTAASRALRPGGLLMFDVSSRYKLENVLGCNTFAEDDGERAYIWKNCYDPDNRLIDMELSFFYKQGAQYVRFEEEHIQRAHDVEELIGAMREAGFEASAYDFLTRESPRADSLRIQFIGRKR